VPETFQIKSTLRTYQVHFTEDWLSECERMVRDERAFFVIDSAVVDHFGDRFFEVVTSDRVFVTPATESVKTLDGASSLVELLSDRAVRRQDMLVAVGGGVVQDLVAFTASILYRGVDWTFIPTTLLAQADSCIGGKTSINVGARKNLVGTFHPPLVIHVDPALLETLPEVEIRSGIGEIMHYYVYADSALLESLVRDYEVILRDRRLLGPHIREALRIKREVIEVDEFDRGERNKFNYGHTFGHALESLTNFELRHGQAVTVGMCLANDLSARCGLLPQREAEELNRRLAVNLPDFDGADLDLDRYLALLSKDKKNVGSGTLTCILTGGLGNLSKCTLPMDKVLRTSIQNFYQTVLPELATLRR
jgi:3-dehydroquinate synthase